MKAKAWLLCLLVLASRSDAAEALEPDFIDYLVQFADDKALFDAADYALISQVPADKDKNEAQVKQAARPVSKEPKP